MTLHSNNQQQMSQCGKTPREFRKWLGSEYHVDDPPRLVLDKLEKIGFRVLTMTGVGQTLVWCLHKDTN
ncbi:GTP cyclohydrolase 1 feedback regulatory protein [Collichthys lucidus]|uniref:GTP cyclohydrolase 1 feedback regulatory protein n=1 Tax=Collichthys lucidus TaxID=240159 RepID=A0A4U5VEW5_COLLU|nr:GTP cyclohydrolase 1 feedback regulatory protein [Collichthys lucidus]